MNTNEDFNMLVEKAMQNNKFSNMRPAVTKELLHYDILFSLDKEGLLDDLIFQGGTSLRLCYGASRLSEDLDFVSGSDFSAEKAHKIKFCIEKYIGDRYGLDVSVKEPKDLIKLPHYVDIKVNKWQVRITTSPGRKDLPKQMIKLEIANVPAHSSQPRAIQQNYDFLPDGYEDILIMTETLDEIMADKIISLPSCKKYIRHRDIWDLRWLKQHDAQINIEYIKEKIKDYRVDDYQDKLNSLLNQLDEIVYGKPFMDEMSRFIPQDVQERTLKKQKFLDLLVEENKNIFLEVKKKLRIK